MAVSQISEEPSSDRGYGSGLKSVAALMHLIRSNLGMGVLSLPWALSHAGIIVGPISLVFLLFLSTTSLFGLVTCSRWYSRKVGVSSMCYGDVAYYSILFGPFKILRQFAKVGRVVVNLSVAVMQMGICCMYYVTIAQYLRQVIAVYWPGVPEDRVIIAILSFPLTISTFSRSLAGFTWLSTLGNILYVAPIVMIIKYIWAHVQSPSTFPASIKIDEFPIFLSTASAAVEGVTTILPLENSVKSKERFMWVFLITFGLLAVVLTVIGITGYLAFGSSLCASITLNLPINDAYSDVIRIMLALVLLCTYPIQFYVPMEIIWHRIEEKFQPQNRSIELGAKTLVSTFLCMLAATVPFLGSIMSLAGSTVSAPLQFLYPSLIMLSTLAQQHHDDIVWQNHAEEAEDTPLKSNGSNGQLSRDAFKFRCVIALMNIVTTIVGIVIIVFGLITSVSSIIREYQFSSSTNKCRGGLYDRNSSGIMKLRQAYQPK